MKRITIIALLLLSSTVNAQPDKKRKPNITIGKETTFVTEPIDKDGYIDYQTALNERLREGVTPDNNAAVLLFKAIGPGSINEQISEDFFKRLKVPPPPKKGDYFVKIPMPEGIDRVTGRPWKAEEFPELAAGLKRNEKALAIVVEATRRSHYYYPILADREDGKPGGMFTAQIAGVQATRELATALAARAMLRVSAKEYDAAWQDLLACHRLGRLVGKGSTLIEGLVGVAIDSVASEADLAFLDAAKLDAKQIKKCLSELQALPSHAPMGDKIGLAERFFFLETVTMVDRHGAGFLEKMAGGGKGDKTNEALANLFFADIRWDAALRDANQLFTRIAGAMRLKDRALRQKHLQALDFELKDMKARFFEPGYHAKTILLSGGIAEGKGKLIGEVMMGLLVPAFIKVQYAGDRVEQIHSNLQVAFALAAYKADENQYPTKLDALAPKYLAALPMDAFSGKALVYQPRDGGYLLYSVGVNGRDDGGRTFDDEPAGDDLPVRMPRGR